MFALVPTRHDPAPSRIRYRLQRLWLTQRFRWFLRRGLPIGILVAVVAGVINDGRVQAWIGAQTAALRDTVAERPEMQIASMTISNASPDLTAQIAAILEMDLPISALDLDLAGLRAQVESLDAVKSATLRLGAQNSLQIEVVERRPVILWRKGDVLEMLDETGARVAFVPARGAQPDLPVVAGEAADAAVEDALRLLRVAAPLGARMRGLVRVGARRWNVVLDRDQTIMLPESGAADALRQVIALQASEALLDRDISVVDMRNADRPILRLNPDALQSLRDARATARDDAI
ncbi:cell division protein FtsQ/DivIB [Abyssibius alkaniclasticus]|uniref:cell division protein FtsQ/DivIB n=1 Tax=Abyssibius alkaniclasticus TaxID=2881234 RepID=UPI002363E206|nr:cell division protein FtsQ/DivIB [Abyssibius alkaniclasticus]UPH69931.1 cell division protein FtsQ/DivIB [Abyssibius alkaniclasticus]